MYKLTPTVAADIGPLSGDIELEAWVTAVAIAATDTNSRSTRATNPDWEDADSDGDGIDDSVATRSDALDLETQLLSQTAAAADAISKRSARTGRTQLADMGDTIQNVQATLERCDDDVCVTVRTHADNRKQLTQQATAAIDNGEWDAAAKAVHEIRTIVEGDIALLETSLSDTTAQPPTQHLQDLTGASADDIDALYEYLAGEPILSEQFTITVPDARLRGSDVELGELLTPRRVIEYVTGRAETDETVYAWGRGERAPSGDNTSPIYEGDAVGGENAIYRGSLMNPGGEPTSPLHTPAMFRSAVSGPVDTGISLESQLTEGRITVRPVNTPPKASAESPAIAVSADGSTVAVDFDAWGAEQGASATTPTLVCPLMVAPPDCPVPFPAVLAVRRCRHADQYIYTGGWVIDDGSLYANSTTIITADGPTAVIGVGEGDLDGDGYGDLLKRRLSNTQQRRGARLFDGTVGDAIEQGVFPDRDCDDTRCDPSPERGDGNDHGVRKKPGRRLVQSDSDDGLPELVCHAGQLSAPLIHFTTPTASDAVKFKAGAELSKSVN